MILATTSQSIRDALSKELEPGETLVACAYGFRVPAKATSDKILRYGLFVFGAVVLYFMRDKVYVGLTDRRLIVLELTERYARVIGRTSAPLSALGGSAHERGTIYHELRVPAPAGEWRFLFFPTPLGVADNADQVLRMHHVLSGPRVAPAAGPGFASPAAAGAPPLPLVASGPLVAPGRSGCWVVARWVGGLVALVLAIVVVWAAVDLGRASSAESAARAALAANDLPAAEAKFREAAELTAPSSRPALLHELAAVQLARGDETGARKSIAAARAEDPAYQPPAELASKLGALLK